MLCCAGGGNRLANKASGDTSMTGKNTSGGSGNTLLQTSDGGNGDNKSKSTATSTAASSGGGNSSSSGGTAGPNAGGNNKDGTTGSPEKKGPLVLGRFEVIPGRKGLLGEGSFSVVQKGIDKKTGATVAVKTYKHASQPDEIENCVTKFNRQIQVLQMLMEPLVQDPKRANLMHPLLSKIDPKKCFLELVDYSRDKDGKPGPDTRDGKMYVVTEVADYSLKDYLGQKLEEKSALKPDSIRQICRSFVVAMAMLHAKGLVHLDMKPENIMRAGHTWKVIDVDGCTPLGKQISINDSSISFSPCYCAPEWAHFLIEDGDFLKVGHQLDVWSVGISLCELIALDAVLKPKYVSIYRQAGSHRKAGFLFLEWLANPKESLAMDDAVKTFDPDFSDMVLSRMLNKNPIARVSLADMLNHSYIKDCVVPGLDTNVPTAEKNKEAQEESFLGDSEKVKKHRLERLEEQITDKPPVWKGVLYKLNSDGDKANIDHWLRRDMWLAHNGNLCYYSQKKNKRLVILDLKHLVTAKITTTVTVVGSGETIVTTSVSEKEVEAEQAPGGGRDKQGVSTSSTEPETTSAKNALPNVLRIDFLLPEFEANQHEKQYYAAETVEELQKWVSVLTEVMQKPENFDSQLAKKVKVSEGLLQDFRDFNRNRREKIDRNSGQYQPVFEKELWKLNSDGDPLQDSQWTFRNMWLAKNGALCYFSKKENKELMYYRPEDIRQVSYRRLSYPSECCRPYAFELCLKPSEGVEYAPGVFAATDENVMHIILGCIEKYQKIKNSGRKSEPGGEK
eukprot:g17104.t1